MLVARDGGTLDVQPVDTDLTTGWVTKVEQTLLDAVVNERTDARGVVAP